MTEPLDRPHVTTRQTVYRNDWLAIEERAGVGFDHPYYVLETADFATVVAITRGGDLVLVRQYRPALEEFTLELPSGHVEHDEQPEQAIIREMKEETGFVVRELVSLGPLAPNTGRMGNRLWAFLAKVEPSGHPEPGIELVLRPLAAVAQMIREAELQHALDLAVLAKAAVHLGMDLFTGPSSFALHAHPSEALR